MLLSRIREIRTANGLTLNDVAKSSGLSVALLSQVERGLTDPSLETLRKLADTLRVPLFDLFRDDEYRQVSVVRLGARRKVASPHGSISYTQVSHGGGKLEVLEAILEPGSSSSEAPWTHTSEECILVLDGSLIVEVSGQNYDLETGDSCHFDSALPHRFVNPNETACRFIVSVTPPSS